MAITGDPLAHIFGNEPQEDPLADIFADQEDPLAHVFAQPQVDTVKPVQETRVESTRQEDPLAHIFADSAVADKPIEQEDPLADIFAEQEQTALTRSQSGVKLEEPELVDDPSIGRVAGGLVAEVLIGELGKTGTAAAGAVVGGPVGALVGYVGGALAFGAAGSITAQQIEGRSSISVGRVIRDSLINLIPGSKMARGGTLGARMLSAGGRQAAIGGGIGAGGQMIETAIEEKRAASLDELAIATGFGMILGGGFGVAAEGTRALISRFTRMTPAQIEKELFKGNPEASAVFDAINEATEGALTPKTPHGFMGMIRGFFDSNRTVARLVPSTVLGKEVSDAIYNLKDRLDAGKPIAATTENFLNKARSKVGDFTIGEGEASVLITRGTAEHTSIINDALTAFATGQKFIDPVSKKVVSGTRSMPSWMSPVKEEMREARAYTLGQQRKLLDSHKKGEIVLPEALAAKMQENVRGESYLTRYYRFYNDDTYIPTAKQENRLINSLMAHGKTEGGKKMTREQAVAYVANLQTKRADTSSEGLLRNLMNPFAGPRGQLKARKELDDALSDYLGVVNDPISRLGMQIKNLERLNAQIHGDSRVARLLSEKGMAVTLRQIPNGSIGDYVPLELSGGIIHEVQKGSRTIYRTSRDQKDLTVKLKEQTAKDLPGEITADSQLFVERQVAAALNTMLSSGGVENAANITENMIIRGLKKTIGASKFSKVVLNPPSWMVQFYGSWMSMFTNGFNPFALKEGAIGAKAAASSFTSLGPKFISKAKDFTLNDVAEFQQRGLINRSVLVNDALAAFRGGNPNILVRSMQKLGKGYSFADDMHRVQQFLLYKNLVAKSLSEAGEASKLFSNEQISNIAESLTHSTYQNYSRSPEFLKTLSQYGFLSQFAAFPIELVRNYYNKAVLAYHMKSGKFTDTILNQRLEDLVREGMDRKVASATLASAKAGMDKAFGAHGNRMIAAQALAYGGAIGGIAAFHNSMGITPEKEKAIRENYLPEWDKDKPLAIWEEGEGEYRWMNMSYLTEVAQIAHVPAELVRGAASGGIGEGLQKSLTAFMAPFMGEGPFVLQGLEAAISNQAKGSDTRISTSTNPYMNALERTGWYLKENFMPGVLREYDRATKESRNQSVEETLKRQIGIRVNNTTRENGLRFRVRDINTDFNTIKSDWRRDQRNKQGSDLVSSYQSAAKKHSETFEKVINMANNELVLGQTKEQTIKALRKAGLSSMDSLYAVNGVVPKLAFVKEDTPTEVWNALSSMSPENRKQEIRKIQDPSLRNNMHRRHVKDMKDERTGVSETDRVLRGQSVNKRAEWIASELQRSTNPKKLMNHYKRSGVATEDVLKALRLMDVDLYGRRE